jgi:hypothetical protein
MGENLSCRYMLHIRNARPNTTAVSKVKMQPIFVSLLTNCKCKCPFGHRSHSAPSRLPSSPLCRSRYGSSSERASERGSPDVNLSYYSTQHKFYCLLLSRLLLPLLLLPLLLLPLLLLWQTCRPPTCASCLRSSTAWIAHIDMDQKSKNSLIEILKTLN